MLKKSQAVSNLGVMIFAVVVLVFLVLWLSGTLGIKTPLAGIFGISEGFDYEDGLEKYDNADYAGAVRDFKKFIKNNPYHDNADDAQYYIYLSYNALENIEKAQEAADTLRASFPYSQHIDDIKVT